MTLEECGKGLASTLCTACDGKAGWRVRGRFEAEMEGGTRSNKRTLGRVSRCNDYE